MAFWITCFPQIGANAMGMRDKIPTSEYQALLELYRQAGGEGWWPAWRFGWLNPDAEFWGGVTVSNTDQTPEGSPIQHTGHVLAIDVGGWKVGSGTQGQIPESIGNLTKLVILNLSHNLLEGSLPGTLGNLRDLKHLDVSVNDLTGQVPDSLGNLSKLEDLNLAANEFDGQFPNTLKNLTQLKAINLEFNNLSGRIPPIFDRMGNLFKINFGFNMFTGDVPDLSHLRSAKIDISSNFLKIEKGSISQINIAAAVRGGNEIEYGFQKQVEIGLQVGCELGVFSLCGSEGDSVDSPLVPWPNVNLLAETAVIEKGLVADGVTPLVLAIQSPDGDNTLGGRFELELTHDAGDLKPGLTERLYALKDDAWVRTTIVDGPRYRPASYAYLRGMNWNDFTEVPSGNEVTVRVRAHPVRNSEVTLAVKEFKIRPTPLMFVHGYNSDASSWSDSFLGVLKKTIPADFVIPINYGVTKVIDYRFMGTFWAPVGTKNDPEINTTGTLMNLAGNHLSPELDRALARIKAAWACTRYDVVGHSQGGVLTRILCQPGLANWAEGGAWPPIISPSNHYRGRFRRVITIGSPHNGSLVLHYLLHMWDAKSWVAKSVPLVLKTLAQPKFDPFGYQIATINQPSKPVDPRMKFHCIRTAIDDGLPPGTSGCSLSATALGLCGAPPGRTETVGQLLLPDGYDGVVDRASQGGGEGTRRTDIPVINVPHASSWIVGTLWGDYGAESQTSSPKVAQTVSQLLGGDGSAFGPFVLPEVLSYQTQKFVDSLVPQQSL